MQWIAQKINYITEEFLAGGGNSAVYECAFLCYVECREAMLGRDPERVWKLFVEQQQKAAGDGNPPVALSTTITDRQDLVDALRRFTRQFDGPRKRAFATPGPATGESVDLLDFLSGFDE